MQLPSISIRPATKADRHSLWEWRNNSTTSSLLKPDQSIAYDAFAKWFDFNLENENTVFAIPHIQSVRVAFVWFRQFKPNYWQMHVYLKPAYCGRGIATQVIREAVDYLNDGWSVDQIRSAVVRENSSAAYALAETGFECIEGVEHIECTLEVDG
jgi:RimJ/RimL family protein N-acetyltransferase